MAEAERAAGSPLGSVQVVRACVCVFEGGGAGWALGGSGALRSGVPGCSGGAAWAVFCIFFSFHLVVWTLNFFFFF